jgi:hypothetical protein
MNHAMGDPFLDALQKKFRKSKNTLKRVVLQCCAARPAKTKNPLVFNESLRLVRWKSMPIWRIHFASQ